MSHLEHEIAEQPEVIKRLLTEQAATARTIAEAIRRFNPLFVTIAARGTSDNAARYAQYVLGAHARLPVALATPSLHTLYDTPPLLGRALVIGISQSGQSEDVRQVIADARGQGALTISITNDRGSAMAQAADYHLPLGAGEEISIAATKTYTAELTAIALLTSALLDDASLNHALAKLPDWVADTLNRADRIPEWVERYRYAEQLVVLARGYNYCTAFEINHKVKELCYIAGSGYSEADFRHGPIAEVLPGFPAIVVAPVGKTLATMVDLLSRLHERNAECLVISNDAEALSHGRNVMTLPVDLPEWLSPIAAVIPGQVFALRLAEAKGHPIDRPGGLTKVTVTR